MGHEFEDLEINENNEERAEDQNMETKKFTYQWIATRGCANEKFGISLNFDERNNEVEIASIAQRSIAAAKNHLLDTYPSTFYFALQSGDIVEAVNQKTHIDEIQKELRTALSVELRVHRTDHRYVF